LAFHYRKQEMQEEANDAKQSRRHDESGGTTRLAMCPARRPSPREVVVEEAGRGGDLQLEEGAILDAFVPFLDEIGVVPRWQALQGDGIKREMVDFFQYVMLYGMKTLLGIEAMNALPALLVSDEAAMRLAGFNAVQLRNGI
jgi:hypothetical protein